MKAHYKLFLSLAIGSFVTFAGCQDDEVVDLVKYPVNQPAITIDDAEGASKATLTAVYKSDGTLELDGPVTRTAKVGTDLPIIRLMSAMGRSFF